MDVAACEGFHRNTPSGCWVTWELLSGHVPRQGCASENIRPHVSPHRFISVLVTAGKIRVRVSVWVSTQLMCAFDNGRIKENPKCLSRQLSSLQNRCQREKHF